MLKIYAGYGLKMVFDTLIMVAILYSIAWLLLGPDVSEIVNTFVREVLR
jgi:hypothetical protein